MIDYQRAPCVAPAANSSARKITSGLVSDARRLQPRPTVSGGLGGVLATNNGRVEAADVQAT